MRDRENDWYDPKAYRSDPLNPYPPQTSGGRGFFEGLLIWLLIGGGLLLAFQGYWTLPEWSPEETRSTPQHLPHSGTTAILDPVVMRRSDVLFSAIEITNNYSRPIAAYLVSPAGDGKRYAVAHAGSGQSATLSAPIGTFAITLEHGNHWCGDDRVTTMVGSFA